MLENLFHLFLSFSNEAIILPFIIIGYIWIDRNIFFHSTCLLLTSMLLNLALKVSFKIPLSPALHKNGFAFPSGHMQSALVFYGWLFKSTNKLSIKITITILLLGISWALLYFGFHNYLDIIGAIFVGIMLLFAYTLSLTHCKQKLHLIIILVFNSMLATYISVIHEMQQYSWMAYYILIGIIFSEYCFKNKTLPINNIAKIAATILCTITFLLLNKIFSQLTFNPFVLPVRWLFTGFSVPFYLYLVSLINYKKQKCI